MVENGENSEATAYATAVEVDGLKRTLDQFMKSQEEINQKLTSGMDKMLAFISSSSQPPPPVPPEDKGSCFKGKQTPPNQQSFQFQQDYGQHMMKQHTKPPEPPLVQKQLNFQASSSRIGHKDDKTMYAPQQNPQFQQNWSVAAQQVEHDTHYEEHFDPAYDWEQHPWHIYEEEEPHQFQSQHKMVAPRAPTTMNHQQLHQYHNPPPHTHHMTFHNGHNQHCGGGGHGAHRRVRWGGRL